MKITKTRLREIIAEEMSSTAYDRDDGGETKTIDSLLDDLGNAADQLNHNSMASTSPASDALRGLQRFRDEKDEEYGEILDQASDAINLIYDNPIGSGGFPSGILDKLKKYRQTSWIEEYVVEDGNTKWVELAAKMLSKERWSEETYKLLVSLKHDLRQGNKKYVTLDDDDQDLLDLSNPDQDAGEDPNPFPMTEQGLTEVIREVIADFKK